MHCRKYKWNFAIEKFSEGCEQMEVKQKRSFEIEEEQGSIESQSTRNYLWFIVPSLLGVLLFLIPISYGGKITIGVGVMAETVQVYLEPVLPGLMTAMIVISALLPIVARVVKPKIILNHPFIKQLFL